MSKRDTYIARMKLQLDELDLKMTELTTKAQDVQQEAREKYDQEMARLRAHSHAAAGKLEELRVASEDGWHKMVSEMEKLREAFGYGFTEFKSRL
jgi:hypothetical protein